MAFCWFFWYFIVTFLVTNIWRHNHFKYAFCSLFHAISSVVRAWRYFSLLLQRVFCSFAKLIFGQYCPTSLSKTISSHWNWLLFTVIRRDKVQWVCVILNEHYLSAANRSSKNLYTFSFQTKHNSLQGKDKFFGLSYCFIWDCRFMRLLRLFSGNLSAMIEEFCQFKPFEFFQDFAAFFSVFRRRSLSFSYQALAEPISLLLLRYCMERMNWKLWKTENF